MLGMGDWQARHRGILTEIAEKTAGHVNLMVLCK